MFVLGFEVKNKIPLLDRQKGDKSTSGMNRDGDRLL
jgi:hypothetical protein